MPLEKQPPKAQDKASLLPVLSHSYQSAPEQYQYEYHRAPEQLLCRIVYELFSILCPNAPFVNAHFRCATDATHTTTLSH